MYKTYKLKKFLKNKIYIVINKLIIISNIRPNIENSTITINKIIDDKVSVSRYGDGELGLIFGQDIGFQKSSDLLRERLKNILVSDKENHIVCLPYFICNNNELTDEAKSFWERYNKENCFNIYRNVDIKKTYYDTQITRPYMDFRNKELCGEKFERLKQIWDKRDIVIVEGQKSRLGVGNDLFKNSKSIKRILCPSKNAFEKYDDILSVIREQEKEKLILIALGPTATVLAYDLADQYQAIDIGHLDIEYEWYLKGANTKCKIENKYVNEVGGIYVDNVIDNEYTNQIIAKIY